MGDLANAETGARPGIRSQGRPTDLLWRIGYRCAYTVLRAYWLVARPVAIGAHVAVWCDGKLLLIRNSYRSDQSVPGGGVNPGEDPRAAAARELAEETGIQAPAEEFEPFGRIDIEHDRLRDRCHFFELRLNDRPRVAIDHREVVAADWFDPSGLDPNTIHAPTRAYLQFIGVFSADGSIHPTLAERADSIPTEEGSPQS